MPTVRSGRMDSFKRGPRARAFSMSRGPERQRKETEMDWDATLRPLLEPLGLDLYDVEFSPGTLGVFVSRAGGVDLESLTKANRTISEWLDANDPIAGRFTLDVSSPGLERRLRTAGHFKSAIGEVVTLRELRGDEPTRRLEGTLTGVTESSPAFDEQKLPEITV